MKVIRLKHPLAVLLLLPVLVLVFIVLGLFFVGALLLPKRKEQREDLPLEKSRSSRERPFPSKPTVIEADYRRI
ncbi:MAG: hypothetical protein AB1540_01615 [Bdellovibrionota bacterium]